MTKSQIKKSIITDWIYEINKPIFFCVLVLIAVGLFISLTINPGTSRYITTKNRKNTPDRIELKKYNPVLKKYTLHKEIK